MNVSRNEIRTGRLVVHLRVLVGCCFLARPASRRLHTYGSSSTMPPASSRVRMCGRRAQVGQVRRSMRRCPWTPPETETRSLVDVRVAPPRHYKRVRVRWAQLSMIGDSMIDFSNGEESSGLPPMEDLHRRRQTGLNEAATW